MTRTRTTTVVLAAAAGLLLAGCSSTPPKADGRPATVNPSAGDPVGYLYDIDSHAHPRTDDQTLVNRLAANCTDSPLALEFAATNTALDISDPTHPQDVYRVLADLADHLPSNGKTNCQDRLPDTKARLGGK